MKVPKISYRILRFRVYPHPPNNSFSQKAIPDPKSITLEDPGRVEDLGPDLKLTTGLFVHRIQTLNPDLNPKLNILRSEIFVDT